jgi:hypothetical protein
VCVGAWRIAAEEPRPATRFSYAVNPTLLRAFLLAVPITVVLGYSANAYRRSGAGWSLTLSVGAVCFGVVVLTHVTEALRLLPAMGFGEPHSIGHYIDLVSARGGVVFVVVSVLLCIRSNMA